MQKDKFKNKKDIYHPFKIRTRETQSHFAVALKRASTVTVYRLHCRYCTCVTNSTIRSKFMTVIKPYPEYFI